MSFNTQQTGNDMYYRGSNIDVNHERSSEMLASSIALLRISEHEPAANLEFRSTFAKTSQGSDSSLNGWGGLKSRSSYKTDLCALAAPSSPRSCHQSRSATARTLRASSPQPSDDWGYFVDTPASRH
mmetsp:Transcript_44695/g.66342  ORF Transcript_44695/g.66342 Transcript_44695/m.66342 type:complete len:127 (-) Transcript_44695:296-676(-)